MGEVAAVADGDLLEAQHLGQIEKREEILHPHLREGWKLTRRRRHIGENRARPVQRVEAAIDQSDDNKLLRLGPLGEDRDLGPEAAPANAPGPMAFQDRNYVSDILSRAGLTGVSAAVEEVPLTPPGSLEEVSNFASNLGPVARIVKEKDGTPDDVAAIAREIAKGFGDYVIEGGVSVPATLNFYAAVKR